MIFQQPQWRWTKAYGPIDYGFVHNDVLICSGRGERSVFVNVPTEFFLLLDTLLDDKGKSVAKNDGVDFFLDKDGDRWIFGFQIVGGALSYDLWYYTPSNLPLWA